MSDPFCFRTGNILAASFDVGGEPAIRSADAKKSDN